MKKTAKLLAMLLAVAMLAASCIVTGVSAAEFKDVSAKDPELYEAVQLLNSLGIAKGTSETTFGTSKSVTREQMAAFVYRLMKKGKSVENGENGTKFTDLKDPTFFYMITWASQQGIIVGRSETQFDPTGKISLQDAYVMVLRALGYEKDKKLAYPYGYIDQAEHIGLDENLSPKIKYTDALSRGDVALILYNAFYADMNETYDKLVIPKFLKPGVKISTQYVNEKVPETVCHKIYGIEIVTRRIVATPLKGIDLSALGTGSEYTLYKPTKTSTTDKVLIQTAAIVPDEPGRVENEEDLLEFDTLGLSGDADDYFLRDICFYIKEDGSIMGANAKGKAVPNASMSIQTRDGEDIAHDYYYSRSVEGNADASKSKISGDKTKMRTGVLTFGTDKAYLYNKPENVDNYAVSLCLSDHTDEGGIIYKAGYTWSGESAASVAFKEPDFTYASNPKAYMDIQRSNHGMIAHYVATAIPGGRYFCDYFDSNSDNVVDYFAVMPMTFAKVVDKSGDANKTTAKHTGDSSYRCYFNSSKKMPELYIGDAKVEGGKAVDGKYVFAYVSGPANYIRVAPDDTNNAIITWTAKVTRYNTESGNEKNQSQWSNGQSINAWNSGNTIVGHVNGDGTGLVGLSSDRSNSEAMASAWRGKLQINDTWKITSCAGRVLLAEKTQTDANLAKEYAVVQYRNKDELQVIFKAGGIEMDGTLHAENYVQAFIGGEYKMVKVAKKNENSLSGYHDDNYFVDQGLVENISSYTVDGSGYYTFNPVEYKTDISVLANEDDDSKDYIVEVQNISLQKFQNKLYKFVPGASVTTLPASLAPNGMKYVQITDDTKIVVNYIDEDGDTNFEIYDVNKMPNFDAKDSAMEFSRAIVVLGNRTDSTTTENLKFLYCEIGGTIVDDKDTDDDYRIITGVTEAVDDAGKKYFLYSVVDPFTGEVTDTLDTAKTSSSELAVLDLYKLSEDGYIMNTTGGRKATLKYGSSDLVKVDSYEEEAKLVFFKGVEDPAIIDDKTVVAVFDRDTKSVTIEDAEILNTKVDDDNAEDYITDGDDAITVFSLTETKKDSDGFYHARLILVCKGK